jgi:hypothetical protein
MAMTLVLTATSCRERAHEPAQAATVVKDTARLVTPDSLNSEMRAQIERGVILNQVHNVYRLLRSEYMYRGGSCENELFDKAFCSKSWNKLLMAVRCKEEQTGSLFFEMNHWSMTRYSGVLLSFDEFEVESLDLFSDVKRATVTFTVYESDTYTPARIYLVYEDGRWMIDDFRNLKYMIDVRNAMWDYIAKPDMI